MLPFVRCCYSLLINVKTDTTMLCSSNTPCSSLVPLALFLLIFIFSFFFSCAFFLIYFPKWNAIICTERASLKCRARAAEKRGVSRLLWQRIPHSGRQGTAGGDSPSRSINTGDQPP